MHMSLVLFWSCIFIKSVGRVDETEVYAYNQIQQNLNQKNTVRDAFDEPDFYACMGASPDGLRLIASERS